MTKIVPTDRSTIRAASAVHDSATRSSPTTSMQRAGSVPEQPMAPRSGRIAALTLTTVGGARAVDTLLAEHRAAVAAHPVTEPRRLVFAGVDGMNVYNPTAPFEIGGRRVLAARVEEPESETATSVRFFHEATPGHWQVIADAPSFAMQDPFVTRIGNATVLGGVETYERKAPKEGIGYRTVFYRGTSLEGLKRFATGPVDMKDIRLQQLDGGGILVLTRPQGRISGNAVDAGRGKIGYTVIPSLDALAKPATVAKLADADQLDQFVPAEWGGANEMHDLGGGKVGVLGHIAKFSDDGATRHYYAFAFTIDTLRREASPISIIMQRDDIDPARLGGTRREDLWDVLFSGGLVRNGDGTAHLYVGAGDQESWSARIRDPFA